MFTFFRNRSPLLPSSTLVGLEVGSIKLPDRNTRCDIRKLRRQGYVIYRDIKGCYHLDKKKAAPGSWAERTLLKILLRRAKSKVAETELPNADSINSCCQHLEEVIDG